SLPPFASLRELLQLGSMRTVLIPCLVVQCAWRERLVREPEVRKRSTERHLIFVSVVAKRLTIIDEREFCINYVVSVAPPIGETASVVCGRFVRIGRPDSIIWDRSVKPQDVASVDGDCQKTVDTYIIRAQGPEHGDDVRAEPS